MKAIMLFALAAGVQIADACDLGRMVTEREKTKQQVAQTERCVVYPESCFGGYQESTDSTANSERTAAKAPPAQTN